MAFVAELIISFESNSDLNIDAHRGCGAVIKQNPRKFFQKISNKMQLNTKRV